MDFQRLYLIKAHRTCLSLYGFALSCQLIKLLSIHLQGGIHRRNLHLLPYKASQHFFYFFLCDRHLPFLQDCPRHVLGVCGDAKMKHSLIGFLLVCEKIHQLGSLAQRHRKHACSVRVQGACMADLLHMEDSPKLGHHVVRGKAFFFMDYNNSLKFCHYSSCPKSCFSICSEILLITSYMEPARSQPAALIWPPPPK